MKKLLIILIVLLFGFIIVIGAGGVLFFMYKKECKALSAEIKSLPEFNIEEVKKAYIEEQNFSPPFKPTKTVQEINKEIADLIAEQYKTKLRTINVEYSQNIMNLIKNYGTARVGSIVSIQLNNNSTVKGPVGNITQGAETFVTIGTKKYAFKDIMSEYLHLFDKSKSNEIVTTKRDKLNKKLKEDKANLKANVSLDITEAIFEDAGYVKNDGESLNPDNSSTEDFSFGEDNTEDHVEAPVEDKTEDSVEETSNVWITKEELIDNYLEREEERFYQEREDTIVQLKEDNKFFTIIPLKIDDNR